MTQVENAGLEKAGPDYRVGNRETGRRGISVSGVENVELNSVERRKCKNEHNRIITTRRPSKEHLKC